MTREDFEAAHKWTRNGSKVGSGYWDRIGPWVFPTKHNGLRSHVFYHVCDGNRADPSHIIRKLANISKRLHPNQCMACGEKVPDGLKMVVMLLSFQ